MTHNCYLEKSTNGIKAISYMSVFCILSKRLVLLSYHLLGNPQPLQVP